MPGESGLLDPESVGFALALAAIVGSWLLGALEIIAIYRLWPPYCGRLGKPFTPPAPLPPITAPSALQGIERGTENVWFRLDGRTLLFRRRFGFGRGRSMASGRIEFGPDGNAEVYQSPLPAWGWVPITIAFTVFSGFTFGAGSPLVGAVFGLLFCVVIILNVRQSYKTFETLIWPEVDALLRDPAPR